MRRIAILAAFVAMLATPALAQSKAEIQKLNDQWAAALNKGDAAAGLAKGEEPPGLDAAAQRVRAMSRVTPREMPVERVLA